MSKKQRRNLSQGTRSSLPATPASPRSESSSAGSLAGSSSAPAATRTSGTRRFIGAVEFKPDYSHVVSDVKRIGIIAASYVIILIVLSFILNR